MSDEKKPQIGSIGWIDLTIEDAEAVRGFYGEVVGWKAEAFDMGGYADYTMSEPDTGRAVAGVCHARGVNAKLPAQWLVYITVRDLDRSLERCVELGGRVLAPSRSMGGQGSYAVIQDPAGAVAALFQPAA